jgi:hypothetical protein
VQNNYIKNSKLNGKDLRDYLINQCLSPYCLVVVNDETKNNNEIEEKEPYNISNEIKNNTDYYMDFGIFTNPSNRNFINNNKKSEFIKYFSLKPAYY